MSQAVFTDSGGEVEVEGSIERISPLAIVFLIMVSGGPITSYLWSVFLIFICTVNSVYL